MRKFKKTKLDNREIEIKELTVKDIISLFTNAQKGKESFDIMGFIETLLPLCSTLTKEDIIELAPSEIKALYDDFKEVNAIFFDLARQIGLQQIINQIRESIAGSFSAAYAKSLSQDTETAV